jgi:hypothetical protein
MLFVLSFAAPCRQHFESHSYFGLQPQQVTFFQQGFLPCLTPEGKVIMETRSQASVHVESAVLPVRLVRCMLGDSSMNIVCCKRLLAKPSEGVTFRLFNAIVAILPYEWLLHAAVCAADCQGT